MGGKGGVEDKRGDIQYADMVNRYPAADDLN